MASLPMSKIFVIAVPWEGATAWVPTPHWSQRDLNQVTSWEHHTSTRTATSSCVSLAASACFENVASMCFLLHNSYWIYFAGFKLPSMSREVIANEGAAARHALEARGVTDNKDRPSPHSCHSHIVMPVRCGSDVQHPPQGSQTQSRCEADSNTKFDMLA